LSRKFDILDTNTQASIKANHIIVDDYQTLTQHFEVIAPSTGPFFSLKLSLFFLIGALIESSFDTAQIQPTLLPQGKKKSHIHQNDSKSFSRCSCSSSKEERKRSRGT
jgi:hypothetical protein